MQKFRAISAIGEKQEQELLTGSRLVYRVLVVLAAVAVVIAIAVGIFYHFKSSQTLERGYVPPEFTAPAVDIPLESVDARLRPPHNVRFSKGVRNIRAVPENPEIVIGDFAAQSKNSLARFPFDFDVTGGTHAEMFKRLSVQRSRRQTEVGLVPTAAFWQEAGVILQGEVAQTRTYYLTVVASDIYGNRSAPTDVSFTLNFVPPVEGETASQEVAVETETVSLTPLQELARDIARTIDPSRSPRYFTVYGEAQEVPRRCRGDAHSEFLLAYGKAFSHAQDRLTYQNREAFYIGVCDAWQVAIAEIEADRAKAEERRRDAQRANDQVAREEAYQQAEAEDKRDDYLDYALYAILMFILISLPLSLLAIEKHSRSMRELTEQLVNRNEGN